MTMTTGLALLLPRPGPVWGDVPMRQPEHHPPPKRLPHWPIGAALVNGRARSAARHAALWATLDAPARTAALRDLRARLRREGLQADGVALALGAAAGCAAETCGWVARPTQLQAAIVMLDHCMAEMATGEGKTLAIALAAAAAALAGVPVHVVTANDYLATRDAHRLAPLYDALGLRVAARPGAADDGARRAVYAHDIVYATAKDLAFDFLRDRLATGGDGTLERCAAALGAQAAAAPVMRGLCMALLDEADSILLDEAEVPLILSRNMPHADRRAFLWQALALARRFEPGRDFTLPPGELTVLIGPAGEERLELLAGGLGGPWQRPRYRREALQIALAGLHAYRRDEHYVVRDGTIEILDEVTGRAAPGRVWSRGLHTVIALKEGLSPPAETETLARTTFQRFFQRYWRLAGVSGTLREARAELRAVYGLPVHRIALHRPCRRQRRGSRWFDSPPALFEAAAERAAALAAAGRPVLLGTDNVADSQQLSECLSRRGVEHRVLNALHDADEATVVAAAGRSGAVTVATRMAGRGTDIELDAAARAAGGLHVLSCQHNPSRRIDRQLAGRAGRQGEPGSTEAWRSRRNSGHREPPPADTLAGWTQSPQSSFVSWFAAAAWRWAQWGEDRRRAAQRRELLRQDLESERRLAFAGPPD